MKYLETKSRSAEHLRAALPLMTRQTTGLHPVSYAVWYEHVSGNNPDLSRKINTLTHNGGTLDEAITWALYREFVGEPGGEASRKLGENLSSMLDTMAASAAQAGQETARFDHSLSNWVEQLLDIPEQQSQAEVLQEVLVATREIRTAMGALQEQLDSSQGEIKRLREEVERARSEAYVDALTGLANRRAFEQRLAACMNDHAAPLPCLVMGDIDFFKRINDSFGHAFGDQVLRAVAQTLQRASPDEAGTLAARVGGEEFALLLPAAALPQALALAEQIRVKVAAGRIRRGGETQADERVTISLGVAQMQRGESAQDFFERADRALYASKRDGRNRVTVTSADGDEGEQAPLVSLAPVGSIVPSLRQPRRPGVLHS